MGCHGRKASPKETRGGLRNLLTTFYPSRVIKLLSFAFMNSWAGSRTFFKNKLLPEESLFAILLVPRGVKNGWASGLEQKAGKCLVKETALQFAVNEADSFCRWSWKSYPATHANPTRGSRSQLRSRLQPLPQSATTQRLLSCDPAHLSVITVS